MYGDYNDVVTAHMNEGNATTQAITSLCNRPTDAGVQQLRKAITNLVNAAVRQDPNSLGNEPGEPEAFPEDELAEDDDVADPDAYESNSDDGADLDTPEGMSEANADEENDNGQPESSESETEDDDAGDDETPRSSER